MLRDKHKIEPIAFVFLTVRKVQIRFIRSGR